jgi:hypothetical protein
LVTSARHESVEEAVFFAGRLRDQMLRVSAVIANRVHPLFAPDLDDVEIAAELSRHDGKPLGALWQNLATLRAVATSERRALEPVMRAAGGSKGTLMASVPLLDHDVHDLDSLTEIASYLTR